MKVRDVMTPDVRWVTPEQTLEDAAKLMRDLDVGSLPVLQGRELVGIVALGDLAVEAGTRLAGKTLEKVSQPSEPRREG